MRRPAYHRLVMLGTRDARGGIAAVVDAYRSHGLFERWPIDYVQTHCDGGAARKLLVAARALLRFAALLARHRHLIVHVHCASRASFWRKSVFMSFALAAGCPFILHLHGGGFARFYDTECSALGRRAVRFFLRRAACVIALSARWRDWIAGIAPGQRIVCLPNPVALAAAGPDTRRGNVVLFVGRVERDKGIFDLLEAVAELRGQIPDIRLVCLGGGDLAAAARYARRLGIEDAVELADWVGPQEKHDRMRRAAVLVLPSYAEGMPLSLLEGMAAGLPVIATAVGGIPDLVADDVNGCLFGPGDRAMLQRQLRRLILDPGLRARLGASARETVQARFDARRSVRQLEGIFTELGLSRRAAHPSPQSSPCREVT